MMNERTTMSNSNKVGTDFPQNIVKREFMGDFSSGSSIHKIEFFPHEVNSEMKASSFHANSESKFEKAGLLTDLVVKIKKEENDREITRELVRCFRGSEKCEDQKPLQGVNRKTDSENNEKESHFNNLDTRYSGDTFFVPTHNEGTISEIQEEPQKKSQTQPNHDSKMIRLVNVSVKLKDLFPSYLRQRGKAHSSTGQCLCIYCQGEYRYSSDSQHLSKNFVKCETDCESIIEESLSDNCDTSFDSDTFLAPTDNEGGISDTQEEQQNRSQEQLNINHDSKIIRLTNVSVKLTDLFPSYLRELGKAHSSTGQCSCIYCRGEYKYSSDLQHLSVNCPNEKQSSFAQNSSKIFTNRSKSQQRLALKMQEFESSVGPFPCEKCPKICKTRYALSIHLRVHTREKFWQCTLCPKKYTDTSALNRHSRLHSDYRPFECEHCPAKFIRRGLMEAHAQRVHIAGKPFKCARCPASFKTKSSLTVHLRTHSNEKLYKCKLCVVRYARHSSLYKHTINAHSQIRPYECKLCSATFKWRDHFNGHLKTHSDDRVYKCHQCPASFKIKSYLKLHIIRVHCGEKPFMCEHCSAKFKTRQCLRVHLRVHSGEKPYRCELCPFKSAQSSGLSVHLKCVHSDARPFKCVHCGAKFNLKSTLTVHLRYHSGERPFGCKYCPAKCVTSSALKTHLRVHSSEKPFKCNLCSSRFAQSSALSGHIRCVHSDVRPFECKLCPATYKTRSSLTIHLRTHSGEKPFSCKHCPDKFISSSMLRVHLRIHSSVDPLSCAHCSAKFKLKHNLVFHLRKVH